MARRAGQGLRQGLRVTSRLACAGALVLGLSACFRPLYGPTASGEPMGALLAAIQVEEITMAQGQERLGHYLRSELIFGLDCSGLIQLCLACAGIAAPRDADQQEASLGENLPFDGNLPLDLAGLRRGDLLFWRGHVGMMLFGGRSRE